MYLLDIFVCPGFENPVVGIHVRRTDKVGTEAAFHPVEEYMVHVEEWFAILELKQKVYSYFLLIRSKTLPRERKFIHSFNCFENDQTN